MQKELTLNNVHILLTQKGVFSAEPRLELKIRFQLLHKQKKTNTGDYIQYIMSFSYMHVDRRTNGLPDRLPSR